MKAFTRREFCDTFGVRIVGDCIRFGDKCDACTANLDNNTQPSCSTVILRLDTCLPPKFDFQSTTPLFDRIPRHGSGRRVFLSSFKSTYEKNLSLNPFDYIDTNLSDLAIEVKEILLFELKNSEWALQPSLFSHGNKDGWRWLYGIDCQVVNGTVERYHEKDARNIARDISGYKNGNFLRYDRILSRMRLMFWTWRIRTSRNVVQYRDYIRREIFHEVFGNYPIDKVHIIHYC
ncbi:MAG: hypothetical protein AAF901_10200 [Bacteroidota bacterium]